MRHLKFVAATLLLMAFVSPVSPQVVSGNPRRLDDAQAYFDKAYTYLNTGRYKEAVASYEQGIKLNPRSPYAYKNLSNAYSRLELYKEAVEAAKKALALQPDEYAYNELGYAYNKLKLYKEAIESYTQALRIQPESHYALTEVAYAYLELGQYEECISAAQKAISLRPTDAISYNNMGFAYLQTGRYEEAVKSLKQAIGFDPSYMKPYNNLGRAFFLLGRHEESAETLNLAIKMKPDEFWPHMNLGNVFLALRKYKAAIEELKQAARLDPKFVGAHILLGLAANSAGEYEQAVEAFTEVLRLKPQEANAFLSRSYAYLYLNRGDEAAADALKYLELSGGGNKRDQYVFLAIHLGYRQSGRDDEASRALENAAAKADVSAWPYPVIRYLRGEITAEQLLVQATDGNKKTEAQAYIGMNLLLSGRRDEALPYLQWVKENGNKDFVEYGMAVAELKRLQKIDKQ